jgi:hypothetical protein
VTSRPDRRADRNVNPGEPEVSPVPGGEDQVRRRRAVRRAAILWAVLAFVAWNAVFDRIIVVSGRRYIRDAVEADARGSYLLLNDSMRPAVVQAFSAATAVGSVVAAAGVVAVRRKKRKFA